MVLEWSGYSNELAVQPQSAVHALEAFMGVVPLIAAVCMLIVACRARIEDTVRQMEKEKGKERS